MDAQETSGTVSEPRVCTWCEYENIPGARFCAQCGQEFTERPPDTSPPADPDTETTGVYRPIGASSPDATWANAEAEQTAALPVQPSLWAEPFGDLPPSNRPSQPSYRQEESVRGLVLGFVATLLIAAVVGYYFYATWFSESLRDDIASWIPW